MNPPVTTPAKPRLLSARRLALLAGVAGLGATVFFAGPALQAQSKLPAFSTNAYAAENATRPAGFADIVEKVKPAVISVRVKVAASGPQVMGFGSDDMPFPPGSPMERFFKRFGDEDGPRQNQPRRRFGMAQGSGFFISADGYAVTNNHVVEKGETVEVTTDDAKTYTAKVIGTDPKTDLALLKVEGRTDFPFVTLSDKNPRIGDWVLAVGNPFGLGGTVTAGIVSARGRDIGAGPYDDFVQIDAPVNKGNSGGPTFDMDGNVIGVNTAIYSPSGGSVGIAFAVPADTVKSVVAQLKDKGSVVRGWIGVQIQKVTPEIADSLGLKSTDGALVAEAQADGPAAKAGVKAGDVIVAVNDSKVLDSRDLAKKIGGIAPGSSVKLGLVRKGAQETVSLTLGELPNARPIRADMDEREMPNRDVPRLGLSLTPSAKDGGVAVTSVDPEGPAASHGFRVGDVIVEVAGKSVATVADVRKAIGDARAEGKRAVLMRVKSGDGVKFVAIPLGRA